MRPLIFLPLFLIVGCTTPFFRSTQGCFTSVGVSVPASNGIGLQIAQYLSGNSLIVNSPARITYNWRISETNNYFWVIETTSSRSGEIQVEP